MELGVIRMIAVPSNGHFVLLSLRFTVRWRLASMEKDAEPFILLLSPFTHAHWLTRWPCPKLLCSIGLSAKTVPEPDCLKLPMLEMGCICTNYPYHNINISTIMVLFVNNRISKKSATWWLSSKFTKAKYLEPLSRILHGCSLSSNGKPYVGRGEENYVHLLGAVI